MITLEQLQSIMPAAGPRASVFLIPLNEAMDEVESNTPERQAAFLAQVAHESGSLRYVEEIASGKAYEGRGDLGNTSPGDGVRYKGRGLLQITGRANYAEASAALFGDRDILLAEPTILSEPAHAARSAAWFWHSRRLNELADGGKFEVITKRINGGLNGYADRLAYYLRAQQVLA